VSFRLGIVTHHGARRKMVTLVRLDGGDNLRESVGIFDITAMSGNLAQCFCNIRMNQSWLILFV
jgi:hypothetical protein